MLDRLILKRSQKSGLFCESSHSVKHAVGLHKTQALNLPPGQVTAPARRKVPLCFRCQQRSTSSHVTLTLPWVEGYSDPLLHTMVRGDGDHRRDQQPAKCARHTIRSQLLLPPKLWFLITGILRGYCQCQPWVPGESHLTEPIWLSLDFLGRARAWTVL